MMLWNDHDLQRLGLGRDDDQHGPLLGPALIGGVLLYRGLDRPASGAPAGPRPSPEHLLAERFARGEIDEEEYRRRLATLTRAARVRRLHDRASSR